MNDGWLKIGFRILSLPNQKSEEDYFYPLDGPRVEIEVLKDQQIKDFVATEASTNVFAVPRSSVYICPPIKPIKDVKKMVCPHSICMTTKDGCLQIERDARLEPYKSTIWLLYAKKNGSFTKAVCVDALEELDFRLCELSVQRKPNENHSIAFYFRATDKDHARSPQDFILLFCIFMDPLTGKLEYLGSTEAGAYSRLQSVWFRDICTLDERLKDVECSFFIAHPDDRITQICDFQKSTKEVCPRFQRIGTSGECSVEWLDLRKCDHCEAID